MHNPDGRIKLYPSLRSEQEHSLYISFWPPSAMFRYVGARLELVTGTVIMLNSIHRSIVTGVVIDVANLPK